MDQLNDKLSTEVPQLSWVKRNMGISISDAYVQSISDYVQQLSTKGIVVNNASSLIKYLIDNVSNEANTTEAAALSELKQHNADLQNELSGVIVSYDQLKQDYEVLNKLNNELKQDNLKCFEDIKLLQQRLNNSPKQQAYVAPEPEGIPVKRIGLFSILSKMGK
jgi:chromosome segregation ATPase